MVSTKILDRRKIVENTPWELLTEERLSEQPFSGLMIKVFRVGKGWNIHALARRLGIKRSSAVTRLEQQDKIGIKKAKELAYIFDIPDYRIFRSKDDLNKYKPSKTALQELKAAEKLKEFDKIFITAMYLSVDDKGKEIIVVKLKSRKRKFPAKVETISIIVEKV